MEEERGRMKKQHTISASLGMEFTVTYTIIGLLKRTGLGNLTSFGGGN